MSNGGTSKIHNLIPAFMRMLLHFRAQQRGASLVYFALILPMLLSMAGLAIDGSNLYAQYWRMQMAADSAALAGARVIALGQSSAQVANKVQSLALTNQATGVTWSYAAGNTGVVVTTTRTISTYFAGMMGFETLSVRATSGAHLATVASTDNLLPMTIMCDDMSNDPDAGFTYGATYTFWNNDMTQPGNFGWVDWTGPPVSDSELAANIANPGNSGVWHVGDWVPAGPGVKAGAPVKAAVDKWLNKAVTIPLYSAVSGTGSSTQYKVCTFAEFILTGYDFSGSNKWVKGAFVRTLARAGSVGGSAPDFGVQSIRLTQ
jgi:Flp pilus assembly protein TadG